ncbi:ABC transporter ATP-binding protein/permease [Phocea massiliensis]|uniref:ABC transporter ATP-binding protein n=1 Tax=Merdimmobilis hominis TaxID=2897707 RepID=UPI000D7AEBC5|nr:ABC transporter ATP-binding protein [Merdimmobilis hominis]MCD4836713.1 ABC transporter ATP-binding protein/permease [Merdimmobilis hominis]PWL59172.1 MAG: ABC transporter [Oscillospiraceae bacterium]
MIKKFAPYLSKYKKWVGMGCLCGIMEAVFEMLIPLVMANIVDVGVQNHDAAYTIRMGLLMAAMAVVSMGFGMGLARCSSIAGQSFGAELREAQYNKIQEYSFSNIERFSTASLITRLTNDVNAMQMSITMGMRILVRAPVMLVSALFLAVMINAKLAMVFLVAIPVLLGSLYFIISHVRKRFGILQGRIDNMNTAVQENLIGIRTVKAFVREDFERKKFETANGNLRKASEEAFGFVVLNMPVMQMVMFSTIIAILWFGGGMVYTGALQVGKLTSFITYVTQILMSLMMVSMIFMMLSRSVASARRILEVLEEVPDINDNACDPQAQVADGSVVFDHVNFSYDGKEDDLVLTDVNLTIPSGSTVGILGGTGSAKTTLVQLIPRLYDVTSGRVLVGGRDVRDYSLEHLRNTVAMVLQQNTLFSGTIRENLLWGDESASDEEIWAACQAACADEFISRMPQGLETDLGQGGVNVSGGQKQRLCIARAILKKPKVLILDDSTSAVDTATDAKIRRAFREDLSGTTKIIIAQRVSSISDADQIIVLDDGHVAAHGTHEELMESCDIYREVYQSQQEGAGLSE